jgi:acetyltransferase-like isoleucine patch superfamily enzyme
VARVALRRLRQAWTLARWRPFFGRLGAGSVLGRAYRSRGVRRVAVGAQVQLGPLWRLEVVPGGPPARGPRVTIGDRTSAEIGLHVAAADRVHIGADVLIASWVFITDHDHRTDAELPPRLAGIAAPRPVTIGDGVWLGERCVILPGVELGPRCVVGAGAVVTRSFPAGTVIGGVPARPLAGAGPGG